jgi:hypothetical protein
LSLLEQTYKHYNILIVDNHSVDGSIEELNILFPQIIIIRNEENIGFAGGCNVGIKYAIEKKFDYIFLLNNDTVAHPQMLEKLIDCGNKNPRAAIFTGKIYYQDEPNKIWYAGGKISYWKSEGMHFRLKKNDKIEKSNSKVPIEVSFVSGCCMLLPIKTIQSVGFFDENFFLYYEDLDYCLRTIKKGYALLYLNDAIVWHNVSRSQKLRKRYFNFITETYYYKLRSRIIFLNKNAKGFYLLSGYMFLGLYIFKMVISAIILFRIDILLSILKALYNKKSSIMK